MPTRPASLTVATDASVGHHRGAAVAGIAWVNSSGEYAIDICSTRVPFVAELTAIHRAVIDADHRESLTVLTDCRPAVHAVTTVVSTRSIPTASGIREHHSIARLLRLIVVELRRRPIRLVWVKGHHGHPLNEVADRLAVQARRCAQNGGRLAAITPLTDQIASDMWTPAKTAY